MHKEPSLTLDALSSVLDGVQDPIDVGKWLQIPCSKRAELWRHYDWRQLSRAYSTVFLTEVPSPSWNTLALALWHTGELGALEVLQKLHLKGKPCEHGCRSEGEPTGYIVASLKGWVSCEESILLDQKKPSEFIKKFSRYICIRVRMYVKIHTE
jgi:hypothetical protein